MSARVEREQLVVDVLDSGPGFSDRQLAKLGQVGRSRKGAGHGLGLFLAANVARRLGGALQASNRPEGGASVCLSLPLIAAGEGAA
jgi:two-component system sensor histidine kinase RegB